jgi:hypothetical protein
LADIAMRAWNCLAIAIDTRVAVLNLFSKSAAH